jgi:hypothetical protein
MRRAVASLAVLSFVAACSSSGTPAAPPREWFVDGTADAGLDFVHVNGMSGKYYMAEIMAPGVALFDYDNDGDLDVYLVQGQTLDPAADGARSREAGAVRPSLSKRSRDPAGRHAETPLHGRHAGKPHRGARLRHGRGGRRLRQRRLDGPVPDEVRRPQSAASQQRRRHFTDVSKASGTDERSWSVSASFVDIDRDGWLDLYVTDYLRYSLASNPPCYNASGVVGYCTPHSFDGLTDHLYRNKGDGTFVDVTLSSGVAHEQRPGLGVVAADFNRDGWPDIYVANDGRENLLWLNRHDGTFEEGALLAGVALPLTAKAEASMGVDAGDADGDGDDDLLVTELAGEGSNLFVNDGSGVFVDRSAPSGLGPASLPLTGFGTAWVDADGDGLLDVLSVNGTVQVIESLRQVGDPLPLRQRKQLLRNLGGGRFEDVTARAGSVFGTSEVGRGAAFGDIDNDGDVDVLVGNNNGPARLLLNQTPVRHWIGLRLSGPGGRDMLGARVEIVRSPSHSLWRRAHADGSYASANDPRVVVALGDSAEPPVVRVTWPDGATETWNGLPVDKYSTLREGSAR